MSISIAGLDKADVLAALYNASRPQGMGFLHYTPEPMTREQVRKILDEGDEQYNPGQTYFDYLRGRVMKVNLKGDDLDPRLYDRDLGEGAAARSIEGVRVRTAAAILKGGKA